MINLEYIKSFKFKLFITILISIVLTACFNKGYAGLPLRAPFKLDKANTLLEMKFLIVKEQYYSFDLIFGCENELNNCKNIDMLMGNPNAANDLKLSKGEPLWLSLKIFSYDDALSGVHERLMTEVGTENLAISKTGGGEFVKEIYRLKLQPGKYKVVVETLKEMPSFKEISVEFRVGRALVGK